MFVVSFPLIFLTRFFFTILYDGQILSKENKNLKQKTENICLKSSTQQSSGKTSEIDEDIFLHLSFRVNLQLFLYACLQFNTEYIWKTAFEILTKELL